ncbi:MAG: hypothetical protein ACKVQK_14850 [Burkholderiales bacterium]
MAAAIFDHHRLANGFGDFGPDEPNIGIDPAGWRADYYAHRFNGVGLRQAHWCRQGHGKCYTVSDG